MEFPKAVIAASLDPRTAHLSTYPIEISAETDAILTTIQHRLEENISYASLDKVENIYHTDLHQVIRAFHFSKGLSREVLVIGQDGVIHLMGSFTKRRISKNFLSDVIRELADLIDEGLLPRTAKVEV